MKLLFNENKEIVSEKLKGPLFKPLLDKLVDFKETILYKPIVNEIKKIFNLELLEPEEIESNNLSY